MRVVPVALELEHTVDQMLEDTRSGDRSVLRHVADQEQRDAGLLPDAQQSSGGLPHLRDGARGRPDVGRVQRLHRIDHADRRPLPLERRADRVQVGLGEDLDPLGAAEPRRPELDLRIRLLPSDEQRSAVARDRRERHQQQGRLPHARLSADEHERRGDEPASEDPVQFGDAGRDPLASSTSTSTSRSTGRGAAPFPRGAAGGASSTSVPKLPQPGQRPSQRPVD